MPDFDGGGDDFVEGPGRIEDDEVVRLRENIDNVADVAELRFRQSLGRVGAGRMCTPDSCFTR